MHNRGNRRSFYSQQSGVSEIRDAFWSFFNAIGLPSPFGRINSELQPIILFKMYCYTALVEVADMHLQ